MGKEKIISSEGFPQPLGTSKQNDIVNFAVYAPDSEKLELGIFAKGEKNPLEQFPMHKTEEVWHIALQHLPSDAYYAYNITGNWALDPYAKQLDLSKKWGENIRPILGKIEPETHFDWQGDQPLQLPPSSIAIYEMHVRGFTQDPSSKVKHPGTFLGVIEKIPHLERLGINAIELLPIFAFDETLNPLKNPLDDQPLCNYWGYSTLNFFSPMAPYGTIAEFKTMVRALHKAGIEVYLDVVYNHVGSDSFSLLANREYFILDANQGHTNFTGCGNTINCNHPKTIEFIIDSLTYWVEEMHVDGFRFDLASIFCRGHNGEILDHPPILTAIEECCALQKTKLIAEPWDCGGLYQVGSFPSAQFAEWNGKYRDIARRFIKGEDGLAGAFANILCGSSDLYQQTKKPYQSINFITAHDGFTMQDLVSYNEKHNEANGEENRDGNGFPNSWNCGVEGETDDPQILSLRARQKRNFFMALAFSIGTPLFHMGDEYGHTRLGNNNAYSQDNRLNYFLWDEVKKEKEQVDFISYLLTLRKGYSLFDRESFLTNQDVSWHGIKPNKPNWNSRLIALSFHTKQSDLYLAFNASFEEAKLTLPNNQNWKRLIDTSLDDQSQVDLQSEYTLSSYSSLLLISTG